MTIFAYKIEGFMCPDTGELFRISTGIPEHLPTAEKELYIDALTMDSVKPRRQSVKFQTSKTSFASTNFTATTSAGLPDRIRYFWLRTDSNPVAQLAGTMDATTTTFKLDTAGLEDTVVYAGREAIKLGSTYISGSQSYTGCTRGYGGTAAQTHSLSKDTAVYSVMHPHTFRGRRIVYCEIDEGARTIAAEKEKGSYGLEDLAWQGFNAISFECLSSMSVLHQSKHAVNFATGQVDTRTLIGAASEQPLDFIVLDTDPGTDDFKAVVNPSNPTFMVGDGFVYLTENTTPGTYIFNRRNALYGNAAPDDTDIEGAAFEVLTALPDIGALGYDNGVYFGDIITIMLNIWTSTAGGDNGDFDIGIDCGIRQPESFWDIDACRALRAVLGNEITAPLFILKPGADVKETLKEAESLMQAHQIAIIDDGHLKFVRPFDSATIYQQSADVDLDAILDEYRGQVSTVSSRLSLASMVSQVQVEYNAVPGLSKSKVTVTDSNFDDRTMGRAGKVKLDMGVQSSLDIAFTVAYNWAFRWRNAVPVSAFKTTKDYEFSIGDTVKLSHPNLPTWVSGGNYLAAGGKEISAVIRSKQERRDAFVYEAHLVGLRFDRLAPRAPAMRIDSVDTNFVMTMDATHFVGTDHPVYAADAEAFIDGDFIQFLDSTGASLSSAIEIDNIAGNVVTFVDDISGIAFAGDYVVFAEYADVNDDQKERGPFTSASDGTVGGDRGYQWEG